MLPNDFRMQSEYGQASDWPISYDDLEPFYCEAEREIGVSANVEDQRNFGVWFSDGYVYPMERMPQSLIDQFIAKKLTGAPSSCTAASISPLGSSAWRRLAIPSPTPSSIEGDCQSAVEVLGTGNAVPGQFQLLSLVPGAGEVQRGFKGLRPSGSLAMSKFAPSVSPQNSN